MSVAGVVTGDFQAGDADPDRELGGFFLQSVESDDNPLSSEGLFVYDGNEPAVDVKSGDLVRVEGTVTEFFTETQIAASRVEIIGEGSIVPVEVSLPVGVTKNSGGELIGDLERFEGMLIRLPQTLTVASLYRLEQFGEIMLRSGGRHGAYTNHATPSVAGYATFIEQIRSRELLLDDGRRGAYLRPIAYLPAAGESGHTLRAGDTVDNLTGVLRYSRGSGAAGSEAYRLMPVADVVFESRNPRPPPPIVAGALRVASVNASNFFATIDDGVARCRAGCRGADSADELSRQLAKLVTTLLALDADIVGVVEIENDDGVALQLLVEAMNQDSQRKYAHVGTGVMGTDSIAVGLVFDTATIETVGEHAVLDARVDERFDTRRNRPALAQTFRRLDNGGELTVSLVHLKSKGSSCAAVGDPNLGDGQGNCNRTRTLAATALIDWLATNPTGNGDGDILVIGDFNAYPFEDPMARFRDAGYVNLLAENSATGTYTYGFDGLVGSLDHALASPSLTRQVLDTAIWHINADEAPLLDYNLDNDRESTYFDPALPYRSGDHEPLLIGLELRAQ